MDFTEQLEEPHTLQEIAAAKAAEELSNNWATAILSGEKLENLIPDIDEVINALIEWKKKLEEKTLYRIAVVPKGGGRVQYIHSADLGRVDGNICYIKGVHYSESGTLRFKGDEAERIAFLIGEYYKHNPKVGQVRVDRKDKPANKE